MQEGKKLVVIARFVPELHAMRHMAKRDNLDITLDTMTFTAMFYLSRSIGQSCVKGMSKNFSVFC